MATLGSLIVKIGADIKDFTQGLDRVAKSTGDLGKFTATAADVAGKALTVVGAAASAAGVNATRMAIDFESSFAGVKKTTDATKEEFAALSRGLRDLAQEVPVGVNELNKIAETGGALGVAKEALVEFTKTIAMVATSSNLTADNAANSFARIGNVMGITAKEFGQMGAAVIDLGNKGASTETDITEMAQRLAGAGQAIRMSTADVLGLAAAMADVGIEAEMGGSAMSRLMINIAADVSKGGDDLKAWADIAGMSAANFATAFKNDPASAIASFIEGLGRVKASGGDLFQTLADLDIKEIRLRDTVLRLAGAKDGLTKSLENSRTAWEQNTALTNEAGKRYETSASQIQLFQNRISDTQITLGTALIPVLLQALDLAAPLISMLKSWADGFAALDPTMQTTIAAVTGLSAVLYPAIIALAGFTRAIQTLVPLVTSLWGIIAAHPFVAIGVAAAALAIVIYKHWDEIHAATVRLGKGFNAIITAGLDPLVSAITTFRNTVINLCQQIADGVKTYMSDKLLAIFGKVKAGIEEVKGYFKGLYDAVVGHSYIPDMVDEIGDHMRNLDVTMTAPARNAVVNTGHVIEGGVLTWGSTINQFASTANQSWGSISQTFASSLAQMTVGAVQWGEVMKQMGVQLLTNMITLSIGLATQWAIGEAMRTTATVSGEAARAAANTAANGSIMASNTVAATTSATVWSASFDAIYGQILLLGTAVQAFFVETLWPMIVQFATAIMGVLEAIASALGLSAMFGNFWGAVGAGVLLAAVAGISAALATGAFAKGGIVTGPTLGLMGEAGSPEAAIPLNDRGAAFMQKTMGLGGGGGQQIIYLQVDKRTIARAVFDGMPGVVYARTGLA